MCVSRKDLPDVQLPSVRVHAWVPLTGCAQVVRPEIGYEASLKILCSLRCRCTSAANLSAGSAMSHGRGQQLSRKDARAEAAGTPGTQRTPPARRYRCVAPEAAAAQRCGGGAAFTSLSQNFWMSC